MSSQLLLYTGPGTSPLCVEALCAQVHNLYDDRIHRLQEVNSLTTCWTDPESVKALLVPGGNFIEMTSAAGDEIERVRNILGRHHVSYYGICAGGILASSALQIQYQPGKVSEMAIDGGGFLRCEAIAPLFPRAKPGGITLADLRVVNIRTRDSTIPMVHISGPAYRHTPDIPEMEVLARYEETPPLQVAETPIEPGHLCESLLHRTERAAQIITGSHPEISSATIRSVTFKSAFDPSAAEQEKIASLLDSSDGARTALIRTHLQTLGVTCKP